MLTVTGSGGGVGCALVSGASAWKAEPITKKIVPATRNVQRGEYAPESGMSGATAIQRVPAV
jgi:hypothetical protein